MTEQEWLECGDPELMTPSLEGKRISDRKMRLFAVACCNNVIHLFPDDARSNAVDLAEKYADGKGSMYKLRASRKRADKGLKQRVSDPETPHFCSTRETIWAIGEAAWDNTVGWPFGGPNSGIEAATRAARSAAWAMGYAAASDKWDGPPFEPAMKAARSAMREKLAHVLRCVVGNPLRPSTVDLSLLTRTVTALAQSIYDDRAFDRLPILGDALEDAGCTNEEILDHCRGPVPHVRGCWVVDLLLGKE